MKTIIINKKKNSFFLKWTFFCMLVLSASATIAQLKNNTNVYIGNNGKAYLASNTYYFGNTGTTKTSRTSSVYGRLIFSSSTSTSGASDAHFLDGYGSVVTTSPFILPIGQSGVYAPIKVIPSTTAAVDAAYYKTSASTLGSTLDTSISSISPTEYWNIQGANSAIISLNWRTTSVLTAITNTTSNLTIVGFDGAKWVEIPSSIDTTSFLGGSSSLTSGSITTLNPVNLSTYKYFSLGTKSDSCPPLIASSGQTKTWNGTWSPSVPTLADPVVISTPYSGGSFACNSLVLNSDVTLSNGQNVEIVNGVTGAGKMIMASEASVVQRASGVTAPNIELTKTSRTSMRIYDYIYWGTPIAGNFFTQIAAAKASTANLANVFDLKYKYVSGAGGGWQTLNSTETGLGFITRIKSQAPFTNATATDFINFKFSGVANNGDITIPITNNIASPNGGTSHVLLANPYPSAIDADTFLKDNLDIDGVLYIWSAATANSGILQKYAQADYLVYTLAGSVGSNTFTGKIASGQGFLVKSLVHSGAVTFTNCMRLLESNNQFYKISAASAKSVATTVSKDRFKLNMTGNNDVFSQILVAYLPEATLNYDRLYDAGRNSVSTAQLYSIFEGDGRKLAINARPSFFDTDVVPLGISKSDTSSENFTISIAEKEGVFASATTPVYLHDKELGSYFDLATGDYTFATNTTALNNRFEIVYKKEATLDTDEFNISKVTATINNQILTIKSLSNMTNVELFDLSGKKIFESKIENALDFKELFSKPQSVYIAVVKLANGKTAAIKLINEK